MRKTLSKVLLATVLVSPLVTNGTLVKAEETNVIEKNGDNEVKRELNKNKESKNNKDLGDDSLNITFEEFDKLRKEGKISNNYNKYNEKTVKINNGLEVIDTDFDWNGDLNLTNKPSSLYLHHIEASRPGQTIPVTDIHQWHLANGWAGIGYHFYITKDGKIYRGRPENAVGAHAYEHNINSLGIAVEGKYKSEKMPQAQKDAVIKLGKYLRNKYSIKDIYGHGEKVPTDCPGKNFPLNDIKQQILSYNIESNQNMKVEYQTYVQDSGWQQWVEQGKTSGTTGKSKKVEGIKIKLINQPGDLKIKYRTHVEDIGWQSWVTDGQLAGTSGKGKRIEGLEVKLEGQDANKYKVEYRAHVEDIGWQSWVADGQLAGTTGKGKRIESIEVRIVETESKPEIKYQTHVEDIGWQGWKENGQLAGTTGKAKQMEGIKIKLDYNPNKLKIKYRAHVEDIGWQSWVSDEQLAGTTGKGKRIEGLEVKLEGQDANKYKVEYRAHVQDIGWQSWVADGQLAGTTGKAKRIEAIEIRLVQNK